jgi:adenylate kinase
MSNFILLVGPPGAGKGTQAKRLSKQLGLPHISSGDIFRENLHNETELGRLAQQYMSRGELVPDDVTIRMIADRLSRPDCANGALLDGFPRTPAQADGLAEMLAESAGRVNAVLYLKLSEPTLVRRLTGRWMCQAQGHIYHQEFNPPKESGVCDIDGSELYQRDDDRADTVRNRIRIYFEQTSPLSQYYRERGLLLEINGEQPIEDVTRSMMSAIGQEAKS